MSLRQRFVAGLVRTATAAGAQLEVVGERVVGGFLLAVWVLGFVVVVLEIASVAPWLVWVPVVLLFVALVEVDRRASQG